MADGTVTIDVLMGTKPFMNDRERVESLLTTLGANAGDQMDQSFANNANKVKNKSQETHDKVKQEFNTPVIAKLEAKAEKAGVTNFNELLDRIPKNQLTRLEAKSERGEVINWDQEISRIPKKKTTDLQVDASQAETERN